MDQRPRKAFRCERGSTATCSGKAVDGCGKFVPPRRPHPSRATFTCTYHKAYESCLRACTPEGTTSSACPSPTWAALFDQVPLGAPAILGHADADGIVALQDLGDVTLQAHLEADDGRASMSALSPDTVSLIALLQRRGGGLPSDQVPAVLGCDSTWRVDMGFRFSSHILVEAYRGAVLLTPNAARSPRVEGEAVASSSRSHACCVTTTVAAGTSCCMTARLHVIDFRMGGSAPISSDLASLLHRLPTSI